MRRGFDGLSIMAQDVLKQDPFSGALFCFRGRRGDLVKVLYWDGQGFCLFAKRLEKGRFTWPSTKEGSVTLTPAQLSMLVEGLEWRRRDQRGSRRWRDDGGHRASVTIRLGVSCARSRYRGAHAAHARSASGRHGRAQSAADCQGR